MLRFTKSEKKQKNDERYILDYATSFNAKEAVFYKTTSFPKIESN